MHEDASFRFEGFEKRAETAKYPSRMKSLDEKSIRKDRSYS